MEALGSGVISGVLATGLCLVIALVWRRGVVPWYEERVYHDAKIEGSWRGGATDARGTTDDLVHIRRQGHCVWGTIRVSGPREGYYAFEGTFRNLILAATYASVDASRLNRGSLTMKLGQDGRLLEGKCVHYDSDTNVIATQDYRLEKRDSAVGNATP